MHTPPYLEGRLFPGQRQSLEAMRDALEKVVPQHSTVPVVLVGGTNGKGSTVAYLSEMLHLSGYRVASFFSPSLKDFQDLLRINGKPLEETVSRRRAEQILNRVGERALTLFEVATLHALLTSVEEAVDIAILEVGLGGHLDATNVTEPILSVITLVDLDHQADLGATVQDIAKAKAGILRKGRPLVTGATGDALCVLLEEAERKGCPSVVIGREVTYTWTPNQLTLETASRVLTTGPLSAGPLSAGVFSAGPLRMGGRHQGQNAALAVAAALSLEGFTVSEAAMRRALESVALPGRLEWITDGSGARALVDGAHNPHGARALRAALLELKLPPPITLCMAVYADKDVEGILSALLPGIDHFVATRTKASRCLEPHALGSLARRLGGSSLLVEEADSLEQALARYRQTQRRAEGSLVIAGSLSVVEEARSSLEAAPQDAGATDGSPGL